ncbi:MAG TPA: hypothetical protein VGF30_14450 [Bacteroidia bacterium]
METKNFNSAFSRKSILVCFFILAAVTPGFSQNSSLLMLPAFSIEMIAGVGAVIALALFMFIAMVKHKNKENKEFKETRNDRLRSHGHHGSNIHRRHTNMGHFKY